MTFRPTTLMNIRELELPFRVGTTSYIIEDDLIANAAFLTRYVQDMQLVLFDLPGGPSNLPDASTIQTLQAIGRDRDLTYTVHLMDDLRLLTTDGAMSPSVERGRQVIEMHNDLAPYAYVLHLDGKEFRTPDFDPNALIRWQNESVQALKILAEVTGDPSLLAVENLESYPPNFVEPVVDRLPVTRCVDIGHLWLDGHEALPHLQASLLHTSVVHIHGVREHDHLSLAHTESEMLDSIIGTLLTTSFEGILTLEVFGLANFKSSLVALYESVNRCK